MDLDKEEPSNGTTSKRLAGATVELVLPSSYTERWDAASLAGRNLHRACACALGLCWPRLRRRVTYDGDPARYGAQVIDYLVGEGASMIEILDHGARALTLVSQSLISAQEVDAEVGNSDEGA